jgi:hypothetical protein
MTSRQDHPRTNDKAILPRASGRICALNRSKSFPKLAESQCPLALNIGSFNVYEAEITIVKCGVKKHGVLAKPVVTKINAIKVPTFLYGVIELHMQVGTPFQIIDLVCCFLPKVANFR